MTSNKIERPPIFAGRAVQGVLVFLACVAGLALIQFSTPNLAGQDGFYHIKMAYLMRTQGLKPDFVWLPLTVLNPAEYVDHHFLFHVLLIPFTFGDLRLGAKLASVLFPALAFLSFWVLLEGQRVRRAWLWTLGLFIISQAFLYRMSMPRAQSLSLAALLLGIHFALTGKRRALFFLAWAYVWLYDAFPLLLVVAGACSLGAWFIGEILDWKSPLFALSGIVAGLVLNPYFPRNIIFVIRHILPKLSDPTSISVGNEWFPYTTAQLLQNSGISLAVLALGLVFLAIKSKRSNPASLSSLLIMLVFGAMLMQSRRFIEYFPPMALLFTTFSVADWWQGREANTDAGATSRRRDPWVMVAALLLILWLARFSIMDTMDTLRGSDDYRRYAGAAAWLEENTPADARVFQTDWDDFPMLFFYDHRNTYLIGLDPSYMQLYDEDLYNNWVQITRGGVADPGAIIRERYGAHYVFSDREHTAFISNALDDPSMSQVYEDASTVIFAISDSP